MFVNDTNLENGSLEEAVQALKGAPTGTVKIGVAKPLPVRIWAFDQYFSCHLSWYMMILTSAYTLCALGYSWVAQNTQELFNRFVYLLAWRSGLCSVWLV